MKIVSKKISLEDLKVDPINITNSLVVGSDYDPCCDINNSQTLTLEDVIDTNTNALLPSFSIKVNLEKNYKNLGQFTDADFISGTTSEYKYYSMCAREVGVDISKYNIGTYWVEGLTENKLSFVESYIRSDKYKENVNISDNPTNNFSGVIVNSADVITYVINGDVDQNGGYVQGTGIIYKTYEQLRQIIVDNQCSIEQTEQRLTTFIVKRDKSDFEIQALLHECYQLGIANPKNVINNVFIDRGINTPCENFNRLSDIKSTSQLKKYNNGSYFDLWTN